MKQLIVHMDDRSTDFLKEIYRDVADITVITEDMPTSELNELILAHDRVVMLGHGSSAGLFGRARGYIISEGNVEALRKKDNIFIWCHASMFVDDYKLKGFSTGMFISEVSEARYCGVVTKDNAQLEINKSNRAFASLVRSQINTPVEMIHECCWNNYTPEKMDNSSVVYYNHCRLQLF